MHKDIIIPYTGYDDDNDIHTTDEIIISDNKYIDTGLLDHEGKPVYRVKEPVGFKLC